MKCTFKKNRSFENATMFHVSETAIVHAPSDTVRRYVVDVRNLPHWDASVRRVVLVRPSEYDIDIDFSPFTGCCFCLSFNTPTRLRYKVMQHNGATVMTGAGQGVRTHETYTFRGVGPRTTEVTYSVRVHLSGWRAAFSELIESRTRDLARAAMTRLSRTW